MRLADESAVNLFTLGFSFQTLSVGLILLHPSRTSNIVLVFCGFRNKLLQTQCLKQQNFTLSEFWRPEVGLLWFPPGGSEGESILCRSPGFWWRPASHPWLTDAPVSPSCSSLCLLSSSPKDAFIALQEHSNPGQSHLKALTLITSAKCLFLNK